MWSFTATVIGTTSLAKNMSVQHMATSHDAPYKVAQRYFAKRARMGRYVYMHRNDRISVPARRVLDANNQVRYIRSH
jgi:hypothetical protein